MIDLHCWCCGKDFKVDDLQPEQNVECPGCREKVPVPRAFSVTQEIPKADDTSFQNKILPINDRVDQTHDRKLITIGLTK